MTLPAALANDPERQDFRVLAEAEDAFEGSIQQQSDEADGCSVVEVSGEESGSAPIIHRDAILQPLHVSGVGMAKMVATLYLCDQRKERFDKLMLGDFANHVYD